MKKKTISLFAVIIALSFFTCVSAQTVYTVVSGDSMWKIAVKYETGLDELKAANLTIKNFSLIYPGQKINIPAADSLTQIEDEVIRLVNVERSNRGLMQLKKNWQVARVARAKAKDMAVNNYFSHTSPTYGSPFNMMENFGIRFSAAGENIAYGQKTPQAVMTAWMNSAGHRSNILSPSFSEIGVGAYKNSNGTIYWSQMFIKPTA